MLYHVKMYNDWWKLSIYSKLNDCSVSGRCWWHPPSLLQCCCRPAAGYWSVSRVLVVSAGRRAAVPPSLHHTTPTPATELSPPPRWQTGEQSEDLWKISNPTPANVQQYGDRDQTPIVLWQYQWPSISSPRLPIKAEIQANLTVCWMVESEARDCDDGASVAPTAHHYSGHQRSVTSMFEHQVFNYTTQS